MTHFKNAFHRTNIHFILTRFYRFHVHHCIVYFYNAFNIVIKVFCQSPDIFEKSFKGNANIIVISEIVLLVMHFHFWQEGEVKAMI